MKDFSYIIREIKPEDNLHICNVIRDVFVELKLPLVGTAYQDDETESMYQSYQNNREKYFIIESNGIIVGGGGVKPLENGDDNICELQKMYFSKSIRGKGLGKEMLQKCLNFAIESNFKICYLETITQLHSAIILYDKFGFKKINGALGNTSHFSCDIHMTKNL
ncbi:GNAT family N-acetyltransferase [Flavobacteriaceae bacterium]|nr:GNAT family N-acetyltransferase [Flavobacteriaceae bacterium]MDC1492405.1 GNAT family N-acetyltransferase [Flavobacteriaceae bacterium]